jgi:hypothetical protein
VSGDAASLPEEERRFRISTCASLGRSDEESERRGETPSGTARIGCGRAIEQWRDFLIGMELEVPVACRE